MSDAPNNLENMYSEIIAEYRRLDRQVAEKTARLEALLAANAEAGAFPLDFGGALDKRYGIDFSFKPGIYDPQELAVQIDAGKVFRCAAIETFVSGVGTADDPFSGDPVSVQATFPWNLRLASLTNGGPYFDFMWRVRDTGYDHEWNDTPQPSLFAGGGYFGPLWLPRRRILGGGANIFVNLQPIFNADDVSSGFFANGACTEYTVHFSFVGHEVPDTSEP